MFRLPIHNIPQAACDNLLQKYLKLSAQLKYILEPLCDESFVTPLLAHLRYHMFAMQEHLVLVQEQIHKDLFFYM